MPNYMKIDGNAVVTVRAPVYNELGEPVSMSTAIEISVSDLLSLASATPTAAGAVKQTAAQANFVGADVVSLVGELNGFLAKLRASGQVAG